MMMHLEGSASEMFAYGIDPEIFWVIPFALCIVVVDMLLTGLAGSYRLGFRAIAKRAAVVAGVAGAATVLLLLLASTLIGLARQSDTMIPEGKSTATFVAVDPDVLVRSEYVRVTVAGHGIVQVPMSNVTTGDDVALTVTRADRTFGFGVTVTTAADKYELVLPESYLAGMFVEGD